MQAHQKNPQKNSPFFENSQFFVGLMFGDCVFFVGPGETQEELESLLHNYGALCVSNINSSRVTHVLLCEPHAPTVEAAKHFKHPVVDKAWVDECLEAGTALPVKKGKKAPAAAPAPKKKVVRDDDDDGEADFIDDGKDGDFDGSPAKKKTKTASAATASKKKGSSAAPSPAKKAKAAAPADDGDGDADGEEKDSKPAAAAVAPSVNLATFKKPKIVVKGRAAVDEYCHPAIGPHCRVLDDTDGIWDALLNQTNIGLNNNKFFLLQVLQDENKPSQYYFHTRWGRVGHVGQQKTEPNSSLSAVQTLFKKKFKEKTGNNWEDRESFAAKTGKYVLLARDYGALAQQEPEAEEPATNNNNNNNNNNSSNGSAGGSVSSNNAKGAASSSVKNGGGASAAAASSPSKLSAEDAKIDSRVSALLKLIFDKQMWEQSLRSFELDLSRAPLGFLKPHIITQGLAKLKQIEQSLSSATKAELTNLSSEYYSLIPHNFGMKTPPAITTGAMVQKEAELLDALSQIDVATSVQPKPSVQNPLTAQYESLGAKIQVETDSSVLGLISEYVRSTHASTYPHNTYTLDITTVFRVERAKETDAYKAFSETKNRTFLWHGTRSSNMVGILSQGFRIAPPEAPVTGYMFGKGVYFANSASKSANYCHASAEQPTGLLILSEVALGELHDMLHADNTFTKKKLAPGKESVFGVGKNKPSRTHAFPDGSVMPLGPLVSSGVSKCALLYDEFVIYETERAKMQYLLLVKFNFINQ
jgi:poly [ADP-ribose] polymerase